MAAESVFSNQVSNMWLNEYYCDSDVRCYADSWYFVFITTFIENNYSYKYDKDYGYQEPNCPL